MSNLEDRIALGESADKYLEDRQSRLKNKVSSIVNSLREVKSAGRKAFWETFIFWR